MDWRAFRASLVLKEQLKPRTAPSSWGNPWGTYKEPYIAPTAMRQPGHWAHEISAPEQGCLLVARSTAGMDPVLQQSVILLCSHAIGELVSLVGRINLSPVCMLTSACLGLQPGLPGPCSAAVHDSALLACHRRAHTPPLLLIYPCTLAHSTSLVQQSMTLVCLHPRGVQHMQGAK